MKALISLLLFLPSLAFADVSVPRAKQYLWTKYDVSQQGGASTPHGMGVALPAGVIVTSVWVYINTQFAASGTESLGISCNGSQDIMAYQSVKNIAADRILSGVIATGSFTGSAAPILAIPTTLNFSQGFGSTPNGCNVSFDFRGNAGDTPYTSGAATALIEYFRL